MAPKLEPISLRKSTSPFLSSETKKKTDLSAVVYYKKIISREWAISAIHAAIIVIATL